jgi:hypothetical protein
VSHHTQFKLNLELWVVAKCLIHLPELLFWLILPLHTLKMRLYNLIKNMACDEHR